MPRKAPPLLNDKNGTNEQKLPERRTHFVALRIFCTREDF
jgi:hypothetical protein